jgi:hypothetical protein
MQLARDRNERLSRASSNRWVTPLQAEGYAMEKRAKEVGQELKERLK